MKDVPPFAPHRLVYVARSKAVTRCVTTEAYRRSPPSTDAESSRRSGTAHALKAADSQPPPSGPRPVRSSRQRIGRPPTGATLRSVTSNGYGSTAGPLPPNRRSHIDHTSILWTRKALIRRILPGLSLDHGCAA